MTTSIERKRMTNASQITEGTEVRVYFNLHKKCFSVQARTRDGRGWKVIAHVNTITLKDARPVVSQSGRARVLAEKSKNVHALVHGYVVKDEFAPRNMSDRITYNPYRFIGFVSRVNRALWMRAEFIRMCVSVGCSVAGAEFGAPESGVDTNAPEYIQRRAQAIAASEINTVVPSCFESVGAFTGGGRGTVALDLKGIC